MSGKSSACTYKKNNAYSKKYPPRTDSTPAHPPRKLKNRKRFSVYPPCIHGVDFLGVYGFAVSLRGAVTNAFSLLHLSTSICNILDLLCFWSSLYVANCISNLLVGFRHFLISSLKYLITSDSVSVPHCITYTGV